MKWLSYFFSRNFENLKRFFTGEPWSWRPWTWCPQGVFGSELSFMKMPAGGRLCTLQGNPHFWFPTIKVRPPDGILLLGGPRVCPSAPTVSPPSCVLSWVVAKAVLEQTSANSWWRGFHWCRRHPVYARNTSNIWETPRCIYKALG